MKQIINWWVFNIFKLVWKLSNFDEGCQLFMKLTEEILSLKITTNNCQLNKMLGFGVVFFFQSVGSVCKKL